MSDPDLSVRNRSGTEDARPAGQASAGPPGRATAAPANRPRRRLPWRALRFAVILAAIFPILCDVFISLFAIGKVYDRIDRVPPTPVALVLGTSKHQKKGPNLFYAPRLEAATALLASGRVQGLLVSGDNGSIYYNEPQTMRRDLVALGVPEAFITLDYAGFRTLDSMVRAKEVFGLTEVVVVSQRFHAQRAVFLGAAHGLRVTALAAADPKLGWYLKVRAREILARTVAVLDVIVGRGPRFLGDPEPVNLRPPTVSPGEIGADRRESLQLGVDLAKTQRAQRERRVCFDAVFSRAKTRRRKAFSSPSGSHAPASRGRTCRWSGQDCIPTRSVGTSRERTPCPPRLRERNSFRESDSAAA